MVVPLFPAVYVGEAAAEGLAHGALGWVAACAGHDDPYSVEYRAYVFFPGGQEVGYYLEETDFEPVGVRG